MVRFTDKKPYEQYEDIKRKISGFHGVYNAADEVVIYGNPCTMQIILEHWTDVKLKSPAKKVNAPLIQQFTGVENYKGRASQRKEIMERITVDNYRDMCLRVAKMTDADTNVGSSNFDKFMAFLECNEITGLLKLIRNLKDNILQGKTVKGIWN